MTKLKSYTLAETLIVLVISVLVISFIFSSLFYLQKQLTAIQSLQQTKLEMAQFETIFNQKFHQADHLSIEQGKIIFVYGNLNSDTLFLQEGAMYFLGIDKVFEFEMNDLVLYNHGNIVQEGKLAIDAYQFYLSSKTVSKKFFGFKYLDVYQKTINNGY